MMRSLSVSAVLLCLRLAAGATEWDDIKAQYTTGTLLAGLGAANGDLNPNEWNNAEGLAAVNAELSEPHSAMADVFGRVYVADKNAHAIRRIDTDGTIHTVAGMNLNELQGATTNAGYNGDGPARQRLLDGPQHAYVMPDGTFYILDSGNHRIRRVDTNGMMTTIINDSAGVNRGLWVQRDAQVIYYCTNTQLKRWTPASGTQGTRIAGGFEETGNIDVDHAGNIYVTDREKSAVYRVPPNYGGIAVNPSMIVAGTATDKDSGRGDSGDPATTVGLFEVRGVAFHPRGGYFVATHGGGDVWYVDTAGEARLFVQGNNANAHTSNPFEIPANDGNVMSEPRSVSVAPNGDVIIASNDAGFIRIIRSVSPRPAPPKWDSLTFSPGAGMRLRWQSTSGEWYLLEQSTSLLPDSWSSLSLQPAAGTLSEFTDTATGMPRRFYRLHSLRAWPN
ncbi:MAG TPA: hypothetical protein VG796_17195 [Verrucomicrobiales bacterium]|jgi:DNA-binding beta-propeller fold protein YncE|nr:hypothetical protein [Verrucomicrobiales bacterium]